jgi:hypothetical protein
LGLLHACGEAQACGFATARWTKKTHNFALRDRKTDMIDDLLVVIAKRNLVETKRFTHA